MAATAVAGSSGVTFTLSKATTGFATVSKQFEVTHSWDIDVATYASVYAARLSIDSGNDEDVDLFGSLADLLGNSFSAKTKLAEMIVKVTGGTGCALVVSPGASNGLTGLLGGTSPTLTIPAPGANVGSFHFRWPTHLTVSNSSKVINFAASGGSGTLTVDVAFVLG